MVMALADSIRQITNVSLTHYRDLVVAVSSGEEVAPRKAEAIIFAAHKTVEDFERDVAWCQKRYAEITRRNELLEIASQSDGSDELQDAIDRRATLLDELKPQLRELEDLRRNILAPVLEIESQIAKLKEIPKQIVAAKDEATRLGGALCNSQPLWLSEQQEAIASDIIQLGERIRKRKQDATSVQTEIENANKFQRGDGRRPSREWFEAAHDDIASINEDVERLSAEQQGLVEQRLALSDLAMCSAWPLQSDVTE